MQCHLVKVNNLRSNNQLIRVSLTYIIGRLNGWQPYTINGAKVIFLNQRPQSRSCKGTANSCCTCDRILQEPFHFCCLSCKVFVSCHCYSLSLTRTNFLIYFFIWLLTLTNKLLVKIHVFKPCQHLICFQCKNAELFCSMLMLIN